MAKSVLVIGMGKFGRHFADKMIELGNEVMLVDRDEEVVNRYAPFFADAQTEDCSCRQQTDDHKKGA